MKQPISRDRLVGHWRCKSGRHVCDWLLRADGTFEATVTEGGVKVSLSHGTWMIEGCGLVAIYREDVFDMIPRGLRAEDALIDVADDHFIIQTRHRTTEKYERLHDTEKPSA